MKPFVLADLLHGSAAEAPEHVAIRHLDSQLTHYQLLRASQKVQAVLTRSLQPGERVAIFLHKSLPQVWSLLGTSLAGGVFVLINPVLKRGHIEHILKDSGATTLITSQTLWASSGARFEGKVLFAEALAAEPDAPADLAPVPRLAQDVASLIYTSGSTGLQKGVVVPHKTIVEGAEIVAGYLGIRSTDRLCGVLPLNFDYGLNQLTTTLLRRATLVLHQYQMPQNLLNLLREEKITALAALPPLWIGLFGDGRLPPGDLGLPHLRYLTNTGGRVPPLIVQRIREAFPKAELFLMYGLTEAFRSTFLPPSQAEIRPTSIGKAIPGVQILVLNERGEECAPGEVGELVHRGALVAHGYWNDPEKTAAVYRKRPVLGQPHLTEWVVHSGDYVKRDEEGYLFFCFRKDDMLKSGGHRVSPTEVEDALVELSGGLNTVVFGRPREDQDPVIVALVEGGSNPPDPKELLARCRRSMAGYLVPGELHVVPSFPRTANDKVDRATLKAQALEGKLDGQRS